MKWPARDLTGTEGLGQLHSDRGAGDFAHRAIRPLLVGANPFRVRRLNHCQARGDDMDRDQHEDLHRRLERLESGYHWWRRTGLVAVALLAISLYAHAQRPRAREAPQPVLEPAKNAPEPAKIDAA